MKKNYLILQWSFGTLFALTALVNGFHWSSLIFVLASVLMMPIPTIRDFLIGKLNFEVFQIKTWMIVVLASILFVVGACCSPLGSEQDNPHEHNFVNGECECGESDPDYVPPHEHNFINGECECGESDPDYVPPHEHNFVNGECECGESDSDYVPPHEHNFVNGKCECGESDPNYVPPNDSEFVVMVWIPETGKKYHSTSDCSNMINPSYVTLEEAIELGFEPCKRCH